MSDGYCPICGLPEHRRFFNYKTLGEFLGASYPTVKTWASLTNTYVERAHPNAEIGWNQLKRTINNLPTGAPMILQVTSGQQTDRGFRPLPPPLAPTRYHGCVIAAWAYKDVLIGPDYSRTEYVAAVNSRKLRAEALRGNSPEKGGPRNG